jgi:hypothetical protein
MRRFLEATVILLVVHLLTTVPLYASSGDPALNPKLPFVVCQDQRYALYAEAHCFVYKGAAYCK